MWKLELIKSLKDPNLIVYEDDKVVAIKDTFPKATFHYLVCPKEDIDSLAVVNKNHIALLTHMEEMASKLASVHPFYNFMFGYHAVPSLSRLHMHVISDDFNSPCLKTKKHWNSFTTDFFLTNQWVLSQLKEHGSIRLDRIYFNSLLKVPLKCHKCQHCPKDMVDLKNHVKTHFL